MQVLDIQALGPDTLKLMSFNKDPDSQARVLDTWWQEMGAEKLVQGTLELPGLEHEVHMHGGDNMVRDHGTMELELEGKAGAGGNQGADLTEGDIAEPVTHPCTYESTIFCPR